MTVTISELDKGFLLECQMRVPRPLSTVFPFFANAYNLQRITPSSLSFRVLTPDPVTMHAGALIDYRLRVHKIPIAWQSEITVWEPPNRFVDEQRRGPYRWWIHDHLFEEDNDSTVVRDRVRYGVPGGRLINRLIVARDLRRVFQYRAEKLRDIFSAENVDSMMSIHG
jgi:ligand-binding SRPBCC domain-containing protein